jgi:signal recognition particle GTPase
MVCTSQRGLAKTRNQLADLFGVVKIDEQLLEDLESALIQADAGVAATESLINALRQAIKQDKLKNGEAVRYCLRDLIRDQLIPLQGGIDLDRSTPLVLMIAGVNGAGKTTSIGKLARHVQREGKTVLLAAGDTFRAAAREQLAIWGQRQWCRGDCATRGGSSRGCVRCSKRRAGASKRRRRDRYCWQVANSEPFNGRVKENPPRDWQSHE